MGVWHYQHAEHVLSELRCPTFTGWAEDALDNLDPGCMPHWPILSWLTPAMLLCLREWHVGRGDTGLPSERCLLVLPKRFDDWLSEDTDVLAAFDSWPDLLGSSDAAAKQARALMLPLIVALIRYVPAYRSLAADVGQLVIWTLQDCVAVMLACCTPEEVALGLSCLLGLAADVLCPEFPEGPELMVPEELALMLCQVTESVITSSQALECGVCKLLCKDDRFLKIVNRLFSCVLQFAEAGAVLLRSLLTIAAPTSLSTPAASLEPKAAVTAGMAPEQPVCTSSDSQAGSQGLLQQSREEEDFRMLIEAICHPQGPVLMVLAGLTGLLPLGTTAGESPDMLAHLCQNTSWECLCLLAPIQAAWPGLRANGIINTALIVLQFAMLAPHGLKQHADQLCMQAVTCIANFSRDPHLLDRQEPVPRLACLFACLREGACPDRALAVTALTQILGMPGVATVMCYPRTGVDINCMVAAWSNSADNWLLRMHIGLVLECLAGLYADDGPAANFFTGRKQLWRQFAGMLRDAVAALPLAYAARAGVAVAIALKPLVIEFPGIEATFQAEHVSRELALLQLTLMDFETSRMQSVEGGAALPAKPRDSIERLNTTFVLVAQPEDFTDPTVQEAMIKLAALLARVIAEEPVTLEADALLSWAGACCCMLSRSMALSATVRVQLTRSELLAVAWRLLKVTAVRDMSISLSPAADTCLLHSINLVAVLLKSKLELDRSLSPVFIKKHLKGHASVLCALADMLGPPKLCMSDDFLSGWRARTAHLCMLLRAYKAFFSGDWLATNSPKRVCSDWPELPHAATRLAAMLHDAMHASAELFDHLRIHLEHSIARSLVEDIRDHIGDVTDLLCGFPFAPEAVDLCKSERDKELGAAFGLRGVRTRLLKPDGVEALKALLHAADSIAAAEAAAKATAEAHLAAAAAAEAAEKAEEARQKKQAKKARQKERLKAAKGSCEGAAQDSAPQPAAVSNAEAGLATPHAALSMADSDAGDVTESKPAVSDTGGANEVPSTGSFSQSQSDRGLPSADGGDRGAATRSEPSQRKGLAATAPSAACGIHSLPASNICPSVDSARATLAPGAAPREASVADMPSRGAEEAAHPDCAVVARPSAPIQHPPERHVPACNPPSPGKTAQAKAPVSPAADGRPASAASQPQQGRLGLGGVQGGSVPAALPQAADQCHSNQEAHQQRGAMRSLVPQGLQPHGDAQSKVTQRRLPQGSPPGPGIQGVQNPQAPGKPPSPSPAQIEVPGKVPSQPSNHARPQPGYQQATEAAAECSPAPIISPAQLLQQIREQGRRAAAAAPVPAQHMPASLSRFEAAQHNPAASQRVLITPSSQRMVPAHNASPDGSTSIVSSSSSYSHQNGVSTPAAANTNGLAPHSQHMVARVAEVPARAAAVRPPTPVGNPPPACAEGNDPGDGELDLEGLIEQLLPGQVQAEPVAPSTPVQVPKASMTRPTAPGVGTYRPLQKAHAASKPAQHEQPASHRTVHIKGPPVVAVAESPVVPAVGKDIKLPAASPARLQPAGQQLKGSSTPPPVTPNVPQVPRHAANQPTTAVTAPLAPLHAGQGSPPVRQDDVLPLEDASEAFCCPITHDVMRDPMVAADGITYERAAIEQWFSKHGTSPMTNQVLDSRRLTPNVIVRQLLQSRFELKQASRQG